MGGPVLPRQVQREREEEMSSGSRCTCHDTLVVKNLNRWFKEKWVDVSRKDKDGKHPPCGRSKAKTSSKGYPKCRPSVKVSDKTPKTSGSMSTGQKRAATKRKRAKRQGVGGKPTIVKEQTTLANHMGLTEEEFRRRAEAQGTVGNLFNKPSTDAITGEAVQPRKVPRLTTPTDPRDTSQTSLGQFDKMDLAFSLIKERKSPEAMRRKLEYDKRYEKTPERREYQRELHAERRRRGIYGSGDHMDVSHSQGGRLTLEPEHSNRARHFKDKGTLRRVAVR